MNPRPLIASLTLAAAVPAQVITLAEGTPASLQIVSLPESNPASAGTVVLQDVAFVPLEITGRTLAQENDATRARRLARHDVLRVELPNGGRVFRYRRAGGQHWGFLHVAADGAPRAVLELPGAGPLGNVDPFADRFAVDADGAHLAVTAADGTLRLVRLDGGTFASTGRADRVVAGAAAVVATSVMLGPTTVFYQTANGELWRCAVADGSLPQNVSPPPVPAGELKDQMTLSRDGTLLVFLYGPDDQQRLYRLGTSGAAAVLPPPPSKYEEPGYLPEDPGEPAMLLSADGSRLFYIDADVRDELYLLDTQGALAPLHVTADPVFQPYIGVSILPKFAADALVVAIGDAAQMDWFKARLLPGGGTVTNLTSTGAPSPPFPAGTMNPVHAADAGGALLVADQQPGTLVLRRLDVQAAGFVTVQQDLLEPPIVGSATAGTPDVVARGAGGDRLYGGGTGLLFAAPPPGVFLSPTVHGPSFSATWVHLAVAWGAVFFYLPDGTLVSGPFEQGLEQLTLTAAGGVVAIGNPTRYLAPGVFIVMNRPAVALRRCLSGAGG